MTLLFIKEPFGVLKTVDLQLLLFFVLVDDSKFAAEATDVLVFLDLSNALEALEASAVQNSFGWLTEASVPLLKYSLQTLIGLKFASLWFSRECRNLFLQFNTEQHSLAAPDVMTSWRDCLNLTYQERISMSVKWWDT